ncbi:hypothetical protein [Mesorhizobium salmacidum]|uniref:Uncharacterized protein n=1 Tax=Mesorhizobium salmacidum TaxID=3015171 RepID=A0ABU8KXQ3_9HYPH
MNLSPPIQRIGDVIGHWFATIIICERHQCWSQRTGDAVAQGSDPP